MIIPEAYPELSWPVPPLPSSSVLQIPPPQLLPPHTHTLGLGMVGYPLQFVHLCMMLSVIEGHGIGAWLVYVFLNERTNELGGRLVGGEFRSLEGSGGVARLGRVLPNTGTHCPLQATLRPQPSLLLGSKPARGPPASLPGAFLPWPQAEPRTPMFPREHKRMAQNPPCIGSHCLLEFVLAAADVGR